MQRPSAEEVVEGDSATDLPIMSSTPNSSPVVTPRSSKTSSTFRVRIIDVELELLIKGTDTLAWSQITSVKKGEITCAIVICTLMKTKFNTTDTSYVK